MYIDKTYRVSGLKQSQLGFRQLKKMKPIQHRERETEERNMRCVYNGRKLEGGGVEQKCRYKR